MMTRPEAEAIYDAGKDTVVRVLLDMDRRIHTLEGQVQDLSARLDASEQRVRQLEEQVAKDSHNSHKPPSSDGLAKPKPKSLRPKSERPTGGQPGHPGHTLRMVEKPDRIVPHRVERCSGCGRSLAGQEPDRVERRQVHDLPEPKLEVTEHQDKAMIDHLLAIKAAVAAASAAGLTALSPSDQERFLDGYERIVQAGYAQNPVAAPHGPKRRGRRKQSKARNLLDRFCDHSDSILAFMRDFAVPFDNNQSERDLRMMKLRQKISGTFRSFQALVNFCRIRGYVSTARKNGLNALEAIRRVFLGNPFVPGVDTS